MRRLVTFALRHRLQIVLLAYLLKELFCKLEVGKDMWDLKLFEDERP